MNSTSWIDPSGSRVPSRRSFLWRFGGGLGGVAFASLFAREGWASVASAATGSSAKPPPHVPRVRRVIQLFMNGGASPMDTFDWKPELERQHGKTFDPGDGSRVEAATSEPGKVMKSPFPFRQHGQCGRWVSSVFPHQARHVDEMTFLMAMQSRTNVHGPASFLMNTGFLLPGFPSLGAWVSYALGNEADNLPTFVVLPDARGLPYNQRGNFSAGFLPATHAGTIIQAAAKEPIPYLAPPGPHGPATADSGAEGLELLRTLNQRHRAQASEDSRLDARIQSYELAARMQLAAPETFDLTRESESTRHLDGLGDPLTADFGRRCLLARRLVERGVRFVQVWSGAGGPTNNWDNHTDIITELPKIAVSTDLPIAGLLTDLRARGLLEDTLVVWSTEFGRMPFTQGATGRDHNGGTFLGWLAGAGVRPGVAHGESDPWAWKAMRDKTTTYDLHATLLHLLGLDHERLTFRHNGADRRLTDVHGHVIREILA
ncbi:MAG: DUF1501 domain-containing protein [Verrucomicrobiales bacterium]|nr:DUF1501 domain-containing protein [Verrucomicrobiales bacterium]